MNGTIRPATTEDIDVLVRLRRLMFEAMGHDDVDALDRMCRASRAYFAERIPSGAFRAWLWEEDGQVVASIGLVIHSVPPAPDRLGTDIAYIMSLVTLPSHRRRGIAAALLGHVLTAVRSEGVAVVSLHATVDGRGIYERQGFALSEAQPEMRLPLTDR